VGIFKGDIMQLDKLKSNDWEEIHCVIIIKEKSIFRDKNIYKAYALKTTERGGQKYIENYSMLLPRFTQEEFEELIKELESLNIYYKII
jgi:hypothetical protein